MMPFARYFCIFINVGLVNNGAVGRLIGMQIIKTS
ncbi:phage tail protein, partial [Escherichia coli]|nr:phage tail protein [Escherichia coli]